MLSGSVLVRSNDVTSGVVSQGICIRRTGNIQLRELSFFATAKGVGDVHDIGEPSDDIAERIDTAGLRACLKVDVSRDVKNDGRDVTLRDKAVNVSIGIRVVPDDLSLVIAAVSEGGSGLGKIDHGEMRVWCVRTHGSFRRCP